MKVLIQRTMNKEALALFTSLNETRRGIPFSFCAVLPGEAQSELGWQRGINQLQPPVSVANAPLYAAAQVKMPDPDTIPSSWLAPTRTV